MARRPRRIRLTKGFDWADNFNGLALAPIGPIRSPARERGPVGIGRRRCGRDLVRSASGSRSWVGQSGPVVALFLPGLGSRCGPGADVALQRLERSRACDGRDLFRPVVRSRRSTAWSSTSHVLAGVKLVIAAAFVAYVIEFTRSWAIRTRAGPRDDRRRAHPCGRRHRRRTRCRRWRWASRHGPPLCDADAAGRGRHHGHRGRTPSRAGAETGCALATAATNARRWDSARRSARCRQDRRRRKWPRRRREFRKRSLRSR